MIFAVFLSDFLRIYMAIHWTDLYILNGADLEYAKKKIMIGPTIASE